MIGAVTQGAEQGKDWLAFALAVYGAIVASSVALYQFIRDRPGVRVFLMWTEIVINDEDFPVQLWQVKVVNHRKRPITMEEGGLILKYGHTTGDPILDSVGSTTESPFPMVLKDGEAHQFYMQRTNEQEVKGAFVRDALGQRYDTRYPSLNPLKRRRSKMGRRQFVATRSELPRLVK